MFFLSKSIYCGVHVPLTLALGMCAARSPPALRRQGCATPRSPSPSAARAARRPAHPSPAQVAPPRLAPRSPYPAGPRGRAPPRSPFPAPGGCAASLPSPFPARGFLTLPRPGCTSPRSLTLAPWCAVPGQRGGGGSRGDVVLLRLQLARNGGRDVSERQERGD